MPVPNATGGVSRPYSTTKACQHQAGIAAGKAAGIGGRTTDLTIQHRRISSRGEAEPEQENDRGNSQHKGSGSKKKGDDRRFRPPRPRPATTVDHAHLPF